MILGVLAIALLIVAVLASSARYISSQRERQRHDLERKELEPPPPVSVEIKTESLQRFRKFTADIRPWIEADVPAQVSGRVIQTYVEAGSRVKIGDPLVRLDETRTKIALDLAQARHAETTRLLVETERLQKSQVASQTAYEASLAEARITRAQLDEARDTLTRHTIDAPFSGVVNERMVNVGDPVNVNQPVVRLVDLEKLRVYLSVTESDLDAFPTGKKLHLRLSSGRGGLLEPEVFFVSRSADPQTKLFKIEAILDNTDLELPGGLQGFVETDIQVFPSGPVVPASAVRFAGSDAIVTKDEGGKPAPIKIKVGPEIDGKFPVLEGLVAGERVFIQ